MMLPAVLLLAVRLALSVLTVMPFAAVKVSCEEAWIAFAPNEEIEPVLLVSATNVPPSESALMLPVAVKFVARPLVLPVCVIVPPAALVACNVRLPDPFVMID